jgi:2-polyprenyl-3-methyl-5-hydroxy-6-metoxy-1,4-benzoquinol methylase
MALSEGYYDHDRPQIRTLIAQYCPPSAKVLELGCASGRLGEGLKRGGLASVVHGIELDGSAAAAARGRLDRVWNADLSVFDWSELESDYDVVVAADVLEHLSDPWRVLRILSAHLTPGGRVVASIPNVRYWKVVADLLVRGEFRYIDAGVLDRTHLRFFTRSSIRSMFVDTGYAVEHLEANPIERPPIRKAFMAMAGDLATVQFLAVARIDRTASREAQGA